MSANRRDMAVAIGIDLGGTWMRVRATGGNRPALTRRRPAPPPHAVEKTLLRVWSDGGWQAGDVATLVIAARGVWTAADRRALARRLAPLARRVVALSDAEAALLGGLSGEPGVLILAGTGSIAIGHDGRGRWERAGGLGPLLGDEGSAFWIGRQWLRRAEAAARRVARRPDAVARIAGRAPLALRAARRGQRDAVPIIREAQGHLARLAAEVARRLRLAEPVTVTWAGGLLRDPWFREGVRRALARAGVRARWQAPRASAVVAASRLAAELSRDGARPARQPGQAAHWRQRRRRAP